jgi:hypothetical protein
MKVRMIKIYTNGVEEKFPNHVISRSGRVFRWTDGKGTWKGRELKVQTRGRYPKVTLWKDGAQKIRLHKIVAHTFLGKPPDGCEIIHRDENKQNSELKNLQYGTRSENLIRSYKDGGRVSPNKGVYGEASPVSQMNFKKIKKMFVAYYKKKKTMVEIAERHCISMSLVDKVLRGYNWNYDKLPLKELKKIYLS